MALLKGGVSRAPSARSVSVARDIIKRRDKPYRTEQSHVVARRRKLNINTTFKSAPDGFQFLPVGTPALAERCKELSRQKNFTVYVVNVGDSTNGYSGPVPDNASAQPHNKNAMDPDKISHHILRLGYHFRIEVVDQACTELQYVYSSGKFYTEAELSTQNEDSIVARRLAERGILFQVRAPEETEQHIRLAIRELFPKIPDLDLNAIVERAWAEGTDRVGTNKGLHLPRRVQLATIARIRHTYTDYDRLLRAFEWRDARSIVEPVCLQKLIEWRGEDDNGEDGELEEMIRETIVIDDDDSDRGAHNHDEADDEDSTEMETGYNTDASFVITQRPTAVDELGVESHDERSLQFLRQHQQPRRNAEQHAALQQRVTEARRQMRAAPSPVPPVVLTPEVMRVNIPNSDDDTIMVGNQLYRKEPDPKLVVAPQDYYRVYRPDHIVGHSPMPRDSRPSHRVSLSHVPCQNQNALLDHAIASIEPHQESRRSASGPAPGRAHQVGGKSHPASAYMTSVKSPDPVARLARPPPPIMQTQALVHPPSQGQSGHYDPTTTARREPAVVDLTSPSRTRAEPGLYSTDVPPRWIQVPVPAEGNAHPGHAGYESYSGASRPLSGAVTSDHRALNLVSSNPSLTTSAAYDPLQPQLVLSEHRTYNTATSSQQEPDRRGLAHAQVAPVQYAAHPYELHGRHTNVQSTLPVVFDSRRVYHDRSQPAGVVYIDAPASQYPPQPTHGAPAVVQQVPRLASFAQPHTYPISLDAPAAPLQYPARPQYEYPR